MTILPEEDGFVFDSLDLKEFPVKIAGKQYVLREMGGDLGAEYISRSLKYGKLEGGKVVMSDNASEMGLLLVSYCLWDVEENTRVQLSTIKTFPHRIAQKLLKKSRELCGMEEGRNLGKSLLTSETGLESRSV